MKKRSFSDRDENSQLVISATARVREETGYAYLEIAEDCLQRIWNIVEPKVSRINELIERKLAGDDWIEFKPITIRRQRHPDQPFHDMLPHMSLAANSKPEDLERFRKEFGDQTVKLSFEVGVIKLVPPTMNGSLSVVMVMEFDEKTKQVVEDFRNMLHSEQRYGWHIPIGQSFYSPDVAHAIYKLNKDYNLNITHSSKESVSKTKLEEGIRAKESIEKQSTFVKEKLLPSLADEGFEIGTYDGQFDHIILHKRRNDTFKISSIMSVKPYLKYAYLPISHEDIQSVWEVIKPQVDDVNAILKEKKPFGIEPIGMRGETHSDQPFHHVPPHISLTVDSDPKDLQKLEKKVRKTKIELKYKIGVVKLIPPTMNGSLSVVMQLKFDDKSLEIIHGFNETLKSKRSFGWHITIGQSFYKPKDADVIYKLNRDHELNIGRSSKEAILETGLERAGEVKDLVDEQTDYFMNTILPYLRNKGYKIGQFKGKDDHVILSDLQVSASPFPN